MMQEPIQPPKKPWMVWVYPVDIRHTFNMAPRLEITKEMRNLGWKVDLIACGSRGIHKVEGVDVLCFPRPDVYFIRHLIFHLYVAGYLLRNWRNITIVLFSQVSALWLTPLRFWGVFNKRRPLFVLDTRTVPMEMIERSSTKDRLRAHFHNLMTNMAGTLADGQTAITQRMAELIRVPPNKLWGVWPSGVNLDSFSSSQRLCPWPKADETVRVIYIGTLAHERNLQALCCAVLEANRHAMNFSLLLYGDGSARRELGEFAERTNSVIQVFAPVPHDQIPGILTEAHIGALPFPDEEKYRVSSPIKLFEYMGAGLPILATRIVCHTDVIGHGDYVFWAEDANEKGLMNALESIWQRRSILNVLGQNAFVAAQNWTYAASAKRLDDALRHGLSLHGQGQTEPSGLSRSLRRMG